MAENADAQTASQKHLDSRQTKRENDTPLIYEKKGSVVRQKKRIKTMALTADGRWQEEEESIECSDEEEDSAKDSGARAGGKLTPVGSKLFVSNPRADHKADDSDADEEAVPWAWVRKSSSMTSGASLQNEGFGQANVGPTNIPPTRFATIIPPGKVQTSCAPPDILSTPQYTNSPTCATNVACPATQQHDQSVQSTVVILRGMLNMTQVDLEKHPAFFEEIHTDVEQECRKLGQVLGLLAEQNEREL
eukprot:TRINITY_DN23964_c0_g3_i1.p1 TRINITY_DN23964_c0_g3~~TRINITY_DN23964_c0_g3_i1.p1  ORF type:complete len:248 (+),score=32.31 TRINITY_DN23964_c0_g3_i1:75-818(+)